MGYGIRFLDSYLGALADIKEAAASDGDIYLGVDKATMHVLFDMDFIDNKAARWTQFIMNRCVFIVSLDFHVYRLCTLCTHIHYLAVLLSRYIKDRSRWQRGRPTFNYGELEEPSQTTSEPRKRSCLSGFELLMRHVELWREKVRGNIECVNLHNNLIFPFVLYFG